MRFPGRRRFASRCTLLPIFATLVAAGAAAASPDSFEGCLREIVAHPDEREGYSCMIEAAQTSGRLAELPLRFQGMIDTDPARTEARRALGLTLGRLGRLDEAIEQLSRAAGDFEDAGKRGAECETRTAAARYLTDAARFDETEVELGRAAIAAAAEGTDRLQAMVDLQRGWTAIRKNDYVAATLFMRSAEEHVFPDGERDIRGAVLNGLAAVAWLTGRFEAAIGHYRQQIAWFAEENNIHGKSQALANLLGVYRAYMVQGRGSEEELQLLAHQALEAATESHSLFGLTRAHLTLATFGGPDAADHARKAVANARSSGVPRIVRGTLAEAGHRLVVADPATRDEAFALFEESFRSWREVQDLDGLVRTWALYRNTWAELGDLEQVLAATEELFAATERLRDLQQDSDARAGSFAPHAGACKSATGYLLGRFRNEPASRGLAEHALRYLERARSRELLDYLDATGATAELAPSGALAERRQGVIHEIAQVQRRLAALQESPDERSRLLDELTRLELDERGLRTRLTESDVAFRRLRLPDFPRIDDLRSVLAEDETLVIFQVAPSYGGSSWALAIDAAGVRAHSLPDGDQLVRQVSLLQGLIGRRDGSELEIATWLGRELLGPVLEALPAGVRRLHLVPDGVLWQLPFDALRLDASGAALGAEYDFELSPSATLWHRWRQHPVTLSTRNVLAMADPAFVAVGDDVSTLRGSGTLLGSALGRLPLARREAGRIVARLGEGELFVDLQASERRLKQAALGEFAILHLAAHALVDDEHPGRSAVMLAPGAADEDGLLQPREIVTLDLRDTLVILSACRSAGGAGLAGEGPLSLARAFLQADSRAVVGSLWPLREDDALAMMGPLARELSRGEPLGHALAVARRQAAADGLPAAAWSGLVVLGDGNWTVPPRVARRPPPWSLAVTAAAALAAAAWLLARRRRARR